MGQQACEWTSRKQDTSGLTAAWSTLHWPPQLTSGRGNVFMKRTRVCGSVPLLNTHSVHIFMTHISLGQCGLQGQEVRGLWKVCRALVGSFLSFWCCPDQQGHNTWKLEPSQQPVCPSPLDDAFRLKRASQGTTRGRGHWYPLVYSLLAAVVMSREPMLLCDSQHGQASCKRITRDLLAGFLVARATPWWMPFGTGNPPPLAASSSKEARQLRGHSWVMEVYGGVFAVSLSRNEADWPFHRFLAGQGLIPSTHRAPPHLRHMTAVKTSTPC